MTINTAKINLKHSRLLLQALVDSEYDGIQEVSFFDFNMNDDKIMSSLLELLRRQARVEVLCVNNCGIQLKHMKELVELMAEKEMHKHLKRFIIGGNHIAGSGQAAAFVVQILCEFIASAEALEVIDVSDTQVSLENLALIIQAILSAESKVHTFRLSVFEGEERKEILKKFDIDTDLLGDQPADFLSDK